MFPSGTASEWDPRGGLGFVAEQRMNQHRQFPDIIPRMAREFICDTLKRACGNGTPAFCPDCQLGIIISDSCRNPRGLTKVYRKKMPQQSAPLRNCFLLETWRYDCLRLMLGLLASQICLGLKGGLPPRKRCLSQAYLVPFQVVLFEGTLLGGWFERKPRGNLGRCGDAPLTPGIPPKRSARSGCLGRVLTHVL